MSEKKQAQFRGKIARLATLLATLCRTDTSLVAQSQYVQYDVTIRKNTSCSFTN